MKHFALPAFIASLLCLLLVLLPAANAAPENAMKAGLPHASEPARIIAAGGVITEIIYALGRSDLIVGVELDKPISGGGVKGEAKRRICACVILRGLCCR